MFPVLIYREGMDLPSSGTYFVVAGNGFWLHKDTGIVKAFVPVDSISFLDDLKAESWVACNLPKVPATLVWQIKLFFRKIVELAKTEANVLLFFSKSKQEYKVVVSEQTVSHGGVMYHRPAISHEDDFLRVASIHSHCDFEAFHSGTDTKDEADFDGFHCTFGHNDKDEFTIAASIVVNARRLRVDPLTLLEGVVHIDDDHYKLDVSEEGWCIEAMKAEVDGWLEYVQGGAFVPRTPKIVKGDTVEWAGDLKTVSFKSVCGEGPFMVDSAMDGCVTVHTNVGLAKFSEKLFKKVG